MAIALFLLFLGLPLLEVVVFIQVGTQIGAFWTVVVCLLTAAMGAVLVRWQGISTWIRVQAVLAQGGMPALEALEAVLIMVGGALLLTPGFATDAAGFLCLLPLTRGLLLRAFVRRMQVSGGARRSATVIQGEVVSSTSSQAVNKQPEGIE